MAQIGRRTVKMGEAPEKANLFKIAGNFMIMSVVETMGEAFALLRKGGVDPSPVPRHHDRGLVRRADLQELWQADSHRGLRTGGFLPRLGLKDANLVAGAAEELAVPMPLLDLVRESI